MLHCRSVQEETSAPAPLVFSASKNVGNFEKGAGGIIYVLSANRNFADSSP